MFKNTVHLHEVNISKACLASEIRRDTVVVVPEVLFDIKRFSNIKSKMQKFIFAHCLILFLKLVASHYVLLTSFALECQITYFWLVKEKKTFETVLLLYDTIDCVVHSVSA